MTTSCETGSLIWDDKAGYGFHSAPPMDYTGDYFAKYQLMDETPMGEALTDARVLLVDDHYQGEDIIDIGIGGGKFVILMMCSGFDVNPSAVRWLKDQGLYRDPYENKVEALTFWDSLEHIPDPIAIVRQARKWVFVSMPIYDNEAHCRSSKHFKPGEHLHYWTHSGLVDWFAQQGFILMSHNDEESRIGREGIKSYAFKRA
jgi:hypothetical protein